MKKRLISFLLALCMALSLVPVGAFAASGTNSNESPQQITDLELDSNGKPVNKTDSTKTTGDGWVFANNVLTIDKGHSLDLGDQTLDCTKVGVVNNGVIAGGKFKIGWSDNYDVIRFVNNGTIQNGFFAKGSGSAYLHNRAGSKITGGFFSGGVTVLSASSSDDNAYTITGGFFLNKPSDYDSSSHYTYVEIRSKSSGYKSSYVLNKAVGYSNPVGTSPINEAFYLFGSNQSVTLTIDNKNTIVDEWRYLKDGKYVNAETDNECPVTVKSEKADFTNTESATFRKVTITSKGTADCSVPLYHFAYETKLTFDSDGFPDTTNIYKQDNCYYAVNTYLLRNNSSEPSTYSSWEYDPNNHVLTLNRGSSFDLSELSKDVTVKMTDANFTRTITTNGGTCISPIIVSAPTIFSKGAFTNVTVSGSGSIDAGSKATFTNITLDGTSAKINGGLFTGGSVAFLNNATISQITGGLFEGDIKNNGEGLLYYITLRGKKPFTVDGYSDSRTEVYVSPSTQLTVTGTDAKAFGRINSTKLDANPAYCTLTNSGQTISFTVQNLINADVVSTDKKEIVLAPALENPTAEMFTVTNNKTYTYGDPVAKEDFSIEKSASAPTDVGDASVAGFYKLDDNGNVPTNPTLLSADKVTEAGKYVVVLKVEPATDTYDSAPALYDTSNWTFTIGKKAITASDFTFTQPANLIYNGHEKAASITVKDNAATISNVRYAAEDSSDYTATAPTDAGPYRVTADVTPDANHTFEQSALPTNWAFTIQKAQLTAADFHKDDTAKTIVPNPDVRLTESEYTVEFQPVAATQSLLPTNAGTYKASVTVHAQNYYAAGELTDPNWVFTVAQYTPTKGLLNVIAPFGRVYTGSAITATVQIKTAEELESVRIDAPAGPLTGDVTVTYYQLDENNQRVNVNGDPILPGTYYFEITTSGEGNYKKTTLTDTFNWWFTIAEPENYVHVEGGSAYYKDESDQKVPIVEGTKVLAGTTVYLVMDGAETPDDPDAPALTALAENEDSEVDTVLWFVDPCTKVDVVIERSDEAAGAYFIMPRGEVWVTTTKPSDDTPADSISSGSDAGTGAAIVLGGAALGGAAYLVGTQLWLEANLPAEAAIPTSRQQLADLLWTAAGRPEPASPALFTDITAADSQKAARWCVEQGLMQAEGDAFQPAKHVFRPQVIHAWKQLQTMQNAG